MYSHTEWIDPEGLEQVKSFLDGFQPEKTQVKRVDFLRRYVKLIDETYMKTCDGPCQIEGRPLNVTYKQINNGRLYCRAKNGPQYEDGAISYVCVQGMPNMLRPFLLRRWVHDIDIENCHVSILYQLALYYHIWPENNGKSSLHIPVLTKLYKDRTGFINTICNVHGFPTDEEMYPGYRKKICKPLLLRILYGGTYDTWLREQDISCFVRCKDLDRLTREMEILREALISSERFKYIVELDKCKVKNEAWKRGVFSKIAQNIECTILISIREFLIQDGWSIHSLIFDGLTVEHDGSRELDLRKIECYVEMQTQFKVVITEKPLFMTEPSLQKLFD